MGVEEEREGSINLGKKHSSRRAKIRDEKEGNEDLSLLNINPYDDHDNLTTAHRSIT